MGWINVEFVEGLVKLVLMVVTLFAGVFTTILGMLHSSKIALTIGLITTIVFGIAIGHYSANLFSP